MRGRLIDDGSTADRNLMLVAWFRTVEEGESSGIVWLSSAKSCPQFDLYELKQRKEIFGYAFTAPQSPDAFLSYSVEWLFRQRKWPQT